MWRVVMRPLLLRPPVLCFLARSFFSGSSRVTESRVRTEEFLRPGLVGLYRIAGILDSLEKIYPVALGQLDDGLLPRGSAAARQALALGLALDIRRVHLLNPDVEGAFDGALDLVLVRPAVDLEGVLSLTLDEVVALLGDDRTDYDLMRVHLLSLPASSKPRVGRPREHDLACPQELIDTVLERPNDRYLRQVPEGERRVRVVVCQDQKHRSLEPHLAEDLLRSLRGRLIKGERVEHVELAVPCLGRERPVEGRAGLLTVYPLAIPSRLRLRAAPGAAADPDRGLYVAGPRAACALLAVELRSGAPDLAPPLRRGRVAPPRVQLGDDGAVDDVLPWLRLELRPLQIHGRFPAAASVEYLCLGHVTHPPSGS